MKRKDVTAKLKGLREEFEKDGASILDVPTTMALALSDVCNALGLSQEEHDLVLGSEVAEAIEEWKSARLWQPVEEKETAPRPVTKLAAVPVA
jgi:hypothetical protein